MRCTVGTLPPWFRRSACRNQDMRSRGSQIELNVIAQSVPMQQAADFGERVPAPVESIRVLGANRATIARFTVQWRVNQISARHAATSFTLAADSARLMSQSQACCAFDAAVKMARLSAFKTLSHD